MFIYVGRTITYCAMMSLWKEMDNGRGKPRPLYGNTSDNHAFIALVNGSINYNAVHFLCKVPALFILLFRLSTKTFSEYEFL